MYLKIPKSKKGVSPIIATLLLIVIAVAAAVVTYSFVMGFIGTSTNPSGQQGQLTYDAYTFTANPSDDDVLSVYIRNIGTKAVTISDCYIGGQKADVTSTDNVISPGTVKLVTANASQTITAGTGYTVRFVCTDGTILEFTVVATAASS
ncbi:MAG: archaellin/type IV pilin N-terminal domain-containing protein [Candidatus Methanosuratincola petrocarbonis]